MTEGPWPPDDPGTLDPAHARLARGTWLYRVHGEDTEPNAFNPRHGDGGRFHFLQASERSIPSLYAAEQIPAALAETIFHDVPPRPHSSRRVAFRKLVGRRLSPILTRRDFRLVELHHPGLSRLGLEPRDLTDTPPTHYPRTRAWAQALHDAGTADGLVWMSRLHNAQKAYAFFGDRVSADDFESGGLSLPLDRGTGLDIVYEHAEAAGITIVHP